jgi:serine/threonine protein kinase
VNGRYKVERKLGAGSFGELYLAEDQMESSSVSQGSRQIKVALKTEPIRTRHPQLEYETRVYLALAGGGMF